MNNEMFIKKLMDVPFIVGVEMIREEPINKIPKEFYMDDRVEAISPVKLKDDKWVITDAYRNGKFGLEPHLLDIVNPETGGIFRIDIMANSCYTESDRVYEIDLRKYFGRVKKYTFFEQMTSISINSYTLKVHFNNRIPIMLFKNIMTGTAFLCSNPYDPMITEDGDITFDGEQKYREEMYEKIKKESNMAKELYKEYRERFGKLKEFAENNKCAVVTGEQKKNPQTKDTKKPSEFWIVTNTVPSGEYTPSVFSEFKDAQMWMTQTAINNFVAGNKINLGKGYETFFDGEKDPYKKLLDTGGQGAVDVFIESYFSDPNENFIGEDRAAVYYSDDTYNRFHIYRVTTDGIPTITPSQYCF